MSQERSQISTLEDVLRTWRARIVVGVPLSAGAYQFGCDQFDFPRLPALWGMTGAVFPWWGWLILAQSGFVYALYEYIRRTALTLSRTDESNDIPNLQTSAAIEQLRADLDSVRAQFLESQNATSKKMEENYQVWQEEIGWITPFIQRIELQEKKEKAKNIAEHLESIKLPLPAADNNALVVDYNSQLRSVLFTKVAELGIDTTQILNATNDLIKGNSVYCTVQPHEAQYFNGPEHKQFWHLTNAKTDAILQAMKQVGLTE